MAINLNHRFIPRRSFLAASSAFLGGLFATPRALLGQSLAASPVESSTCPVIGPRGQVMNPRTHGLSQLPPKRLSWDGVEIRMAIAGDARCQRPEPKDLALHHPPCEIVEILNLDEETTFQKMLGFGGTVIDSDVWNLTRLTPGQRHDAILALTGKDGLGYNLMRIAFGSTDWNRDANFYTYCDLPQGQTDPHLTHFSVQRDIDRGIIDVVREFRAANPSLQIVASVWGVPAWMTSNKQIFHGLFDSAFTEVYADYLVKSVQAYAKLGIPIEYLTVQNEPATGGDRATPAAMWTWDQERDVLLAVAERFERNKIQTKLWIMDHNFDMAQSFAKPLLDDPRIRRIADMVAFHDYRGRPQEMALLGRQFPDIPAVISERAYGRIPDFARLIDILANGATGQISWTTVTDEWGGPTQYVTGITHEPAPTEQPPTDYGKMRYILVVPRSENPPTAHRTTAFCAYQTFTPLIQRGARRIASNPLTRLDTSNAAFRNPDGSLLAVIVNSGNADFDLAVQRGDAALLFNMPANAILSLRFSA